MKPGPKPWEMIADVWNRTMSVFNALIHSKQTGVGAKDLSGPVGILAMLAIWVKVRVKADQRTRFLEAIEADALGSERDEPGCLRFNVLQDERDENVYYFYEVYADQALSTLVADQTGVASEAPVLISPQNAVVVAELRPPLIILNADDADVRDLAERTRARVVTFGLTTEADIRAEDVALDDDGRAGFDLVVGDQRERAEQAQLTDGARRGHQGVVESSSSSSPRWRRMVTSIRRGLFLAPGEVRMIVSRYVPNTRVSASVTSPSVQRARAHLRPHRSYLPAGGE